jgi:hypothetical protein
MTKEELDSDLKQYEIYQKMIEEESYDNLDQIENNNMHYRLFSELSDVELKWFINYLSLRWCQTEELPDQTDDFEVQ